MLNYFVGCLAALLLLLVWSTTASRIAEEKRLTVDSAVADSHNIAAITVANLEQTLARALFYAALGSDFMVGERAVAPYLNPSMAGDWAYLRIALFNVAGELSYSSANRLDETELQRPVVAALQNRTAELDKMFIGEPADDESARRVPIMIPLYAAHRKVGYLAAALDLGYFLRLYKDVELGEGGRIEIFNQDGLQLVEMQHGALASGANFGMRYGGAFSGQPRPASSGILDTPRPNETVPPIGVFRKLASHPLTVVVSRDRDSVLKKVEARHRQYFLQAGLLSGVVMFIAFGLIALTRGQYRLFDGLTRSEQEKRRLIQELEKEKVRAYELASHDFLTGIPNRMLFHEMACSELARAKRSRKLYALLFMDLDKFKTINDTLGHAVGDLLLQAVAKRLRETLREYDLVARLGGDEFVMLISEVATEECIAEIVTKLVAAISAPFPDLDGHDVEVSPSVGIALYPRDGQGVETLLKHADAAMYAAKSSGRNTYRFFDASLNESSARQLELLSRFRTALRDNEFRLHYQPRVELKNFGVVALEALVRWQHPQHGLIFPNEFITLAEQHDLIVPLGDWVINETCRQLAAWKQQGIGVTPVAVNVSARQLKDDALVRTVVDALVRHALPPELLEIEVTESCFIEDAGVARQVLERLRMHGLKIAIDDYGTGFSSLSSLKSLPIYAIKIDRSFVRDIRNDVNDAMIVASTITLAHNLGLTVVAEGVESQEQVVHLKTAGCDQVQGFYFQRPVSASEIEPILQKRVFVPE